MLKILINLIPKSVKNAASQISSTRIQSYAILLMIYFFCLFIIFAEIIVMITSEKYTGLSNEFIIAFTAILAHHVTMLGINKNSKAEPKMGEISHNKENNELVEKEDVK